MRKNLVTIDIDTTAFEITNKMLEEQVSAVVVMDRGRPVGILTERDLTRQVCGKDSLPSKTSATVIMSTPLISVGKDLPIERAAEAMARNVIRASCNRRWQQDNRDDHNYRDLSGYIKEKLPDKEHVSHSILELLYLLKSQVKRISLKHECDCSALQCSPRLQIV